MRDAETTLTIIQEAILDCTYWRAGCCESVRRGTRC